MNHSTVSQGLKKFGVDYRLIQHAMPSFALNTNRPADHSHRERYSYLNGKITISQDGNYYRSIRISIPT